MQAKASGAKVFGFANAGTDLQNCIKQAAEFGLSQGGTRMATLLMAINDVHSLGQKTCEGLVYTELVLLGHERQDPRLGEALECQDERHGSRPVARRNYCAANHWLKAVKAAGTTDADAVVAKMKAPPVNDMYNTDVKVREDGRVMHVMHLWQVKTAAESKCPYDYCKEVVSIRAGSGLASARRRWLPAGEGVRFGRCATATTPPRSVRA